LFGENELNLTEKYKFENSYKTIELMIKNKMELVKIKNRLQKDDPSVRLSKYSNLFSLLAVIVAIISIFFSK
ncbi:hypothetical protein, partial [Neobacillus vireti]|uniref:hypothetical protein n=1 Tax=Neobacillus vireti TaxID=220686 RepID=UPI002FFF0918